VAGKVLIDKWRKLYNEARPRSSLRKMTPDAFARLIGDSENQGAALKNRLIRKEPSRSVRNGASLVEIMPKFG
jgi:hypothetical protein